MNVKDYYYYYYYYFLASYSFLGCCNGVDDFFAVMMVSSYNRF